MTSPLLWTLGAASLIGAAKANQVSLRLRARRAARGRSVDPAAAVPLLFVPGALGTSLIDAGAGGFPVWGDYRGLFFRRRHHDDIDLPVLPGEDNGLVPGGVLWSFTVIPHLLAIPVYEEFARTVESVGYERDRIDEPRRRSGLYALRYDFRRGVVAGARAVETAVRQLQSGLRIRRVHLIGHSWGSVIIHYYLRYGGADVIGDEEERARPGLANVDTFFAVGAPYSGSLRAFYEINHGFAPAGPFGRAVAPHHMAASDTAYQLLPYDRDLVIDERGRPIAEDLACVDTWRRHRWGPYQPASFEALRQRAQRRRPRLTQREMEGALDLFVERRLRLGRRLWERLGAAHPADETVRTVTCAASCLATATKLVVMRSGAEARTLATATEIERATPHLRARAIGPGDGYIAFEDVRRHCAAPLVNDDTGSVPAGSYLLQVDARDHRGLFRARGFLDNLLLHLTCAGSPVLDATGSAPASYEAVEVPR